MNPPFYPNCWIVPANDNFVGWTIEFIALIEQICGLRESRKSVSKATGYPELTSILFAQFDGNMLSKGGAAAADIHRDVTHMAAENADKLSLHSRILQVKASQYTPAGPRKVILQERARDAVSSIPICPKALDKEATLISGHLRLDDQHLGDCSLNDIHAGQRGTLVDGKSAAGLYSSALLI